MSPWQLERQAVQAAVRALTVALGREQADKVTQAVHILARAAQLAQAAAEQALLAALAMEQPAAMAARVFLIQFQARQSIMAAVAAVVGITTVVCQQAAAGLAEEEMAVTFRHTRVLRERLIQAVAAAVEAKLAA